MIIRNMVDPNSTPILYDFFASNCAWRVRNVLHWKNVAYETRTIDLLSGEQKSPEFLKINPYGAVPVLLIDGHYITQSVAICEYLDETRPEMRIFPEDPVKKAQVRQIVELINSFLVPLQNPTTAKKFSSDADEQRAWSLDFFYKGFAALEVILLASSDTFCVGDEVTFADMCIVPQVWRAKRLKPDFSRFPNIMRINEKLLTLEAFQKAHALNHPDCPEQLKNTEHC